MAILCRAGPFLSSSSRCIAPHIPLRRRRTVAWRCWPSSVLASDSNGSCRRNYVAIVAPGLGDALTALPGAGKDNKGHVNIPIPDRKLERLAELERTKIVAASVEVVDVHTDLVVELNQVTQDALVNASDQQPELSGKLVATLRAADALALAVPCGTLEASVTTDPTLWLKAVEQILILSDLQALEQQVCKGGASGPDAELDVAKLRKHLSSAKDPATRRSADSLVKDLLAPGLEKLRTLLRQGQPARWARAGLRKGAVQGDQVDAVFEELGRVWLNALVTWKPVCVLADVPPADAAVSQEGVVGNAASMQLQAFCKEHCMPCLELSAALEGDAASLREEPDFLVEYLASVGLRHMGGSLTVEEDGMKPWVSQAAEVAQQLPSLLNLMTYYTAGEKEARAWLCHRVDRDGRPLPFSLRGVAPEDSALASTGGGHSKGSKGKEASGAPSGVPAPYAAQAIHSSFLQKVKGVEIWSYEDLDALGVTSSGPGAKERARSAGKVRKLTAQAFVQEGDVVEFVLPS